MTEVIIDGEKYFPLKQYEKDKIEIRKRFILLKQSKISRNIVLKLGQLDTTKELQGNNRSQYMLVALENCNTGEIMYFRLSVIRKIMKRLKKWDWMKPRRLKFWEKRALDSFDEKDIEL